MSHDFGHVHCAKGKPKISSAMPALILGVADFRPQER